MNPDDPNAAPDDDELGDDGDDDEPRGPLHGILIGAPFALATDCGLVQRNDEKKIPGCCACLSCDSCGQVFRIDLLSTKGNHACPKCRLEYTSMLVVAVADDDTMLQYALETVLAQNGMAMPNPEGQAPGPGEGDDEDLGDDEPGGEDDEPGDDASR